MRIGVGKKIGGVYVGVSKNVGVKKGAGKGLLSVMLLPFYLIYYIMYYVCIWPFIALYHLFTGKKKNPAGAQSTTAGKKRSDNPAFWMVLGIVFALCFFSSFGTYAEDGYGADEIATIVLMLVLSVGFILISRKKKKQQNAVADDALSYQAAPVVLDTAAIADVDQMSGVDFEYFCADLLRKRGFINVSVTQASNDQGVDVLAEKDGIKYAIQCKNYASPLGNTPVQEVNTGKLIYGCHIGAVLTNSTFTPGAKAAAESTGVLLWDRNKLIEMLGQTNTTT